jgi:hypothetical protein
MSGATILPSSVCPSQKGTLFNGSPRLLFFAHSLLIDPPRSAIQFFEFLNIQTGLRAKTLSNTVKTGDFR